MPAATHIVPPPVSALADHASGIYPVSAWSLHDA